MATQYQSSFSFDSFNTCTNGQPAGMKLFLAQKLLNEAMATLEQEERVVSATFKRINADDQVVKSEVSLDIEQISNLLTRFYTERKADVKARADKFAADKLASTKQS